ncbi:MAG: DUF799 family lipoprotein [Deltaproteobacteria bacterium]|nr:DUF799 family lipoprotein [Deltaproteobacteria bacterium]MBI3755285.1 DUF799 family lipoprotein [Deltaproteobacteria bacterium]
MKLQFCKSGIETHKLIRPSARLRRADGAYGGLWQLIAFRLMVCFFTAILFTGCGSAVQYTLSPNYDTKTPYSIAVLPISGEVKDADARYLFRTMVQEKLVQIGYSPIPLEVVDDKLLRKGMGRYDLNAKAPKELAEIVGADAVIYTTITEWDNTLFLSYASMKIGVKLELYDAPTGEKLWESEFNTKDSDMSFETDVMELGIVKAYEPVIQRVVDTVFSTIPAHKITAKMKSPKAYYDWLP